MKVLCINPTSTLIKDKVYDAETVYVHEGPAYSVGKYGARYLIKVNKYLTVTVSPKRFKVISG